MKSNRTVEIRNPNNSPEAIAKRNAWVERRLVEAEEEDPKTYGILLRRFRSGFVNLASVKRRLRFESKKQIKNPVTDLEIIEHLWVSMSNGDCTTPTIIRPYTVWNLTNPRVGFGTVEDYDLSADIIFNTLKFFTKQGDLVVDPMAVGGVVGDVCKVMKRKCRMFGVNPIRDDIEKYDITKGFPIEEAADLVFWNPQQQQNDISLVENIAKVLHHNGTKRVAFMMSGLFGDAENECECYNIFKESGWLMYCAIQCPLDKSRYTEEQIETAKRELKLLPLTRTLMIFDRDARRCWK